MKKSINFLRALRIALACVFLVGITLLLIDATEMRHYVGWMAKLQLLPAILSGSALFIGIVAVLTLLLGRVYCSVICPLGITQDLFTWLGNRKWMKRLGKHLGPNRFRPAQEHTALRWIVLALFAVLCLFPTTAVFAHFLAPYSLYGKVIAAFTTSHYSLVAYAVVAVLFFIVALTAFLRGRLWCNTLCPVGTMLSLISRVSIFRPTIDASKCNGCQKCARNCKAECIDPKNHTVDMARCVGCYDCIGHCSQEAIQLKAFGGKKAPHEAATSSEPQVDGSRRKFLAMAGATAVAGMATAQHKTDGGLAVIEDKVIPARAKRLIPAGAQSAKLFTEKCTACQLCISACPQKVLRPSMQLDHFMQPEMQFDQSYCPVTCHACSDVCPTGALHLTHPNEKAVIQIGHAVWIQQNCVVLRDGVSCGNCASHCPTGAILMVPFEGSDQLVPAINTESCIGCGHCEYVCPSRPLSAIYVEGHEVQRHL